MSHQRDELIARFMMDFRNYFYEIHAVLRETVRWRMSSAERRRAHLAAGRFYSAPFRAQQTLGAAEKLGARFIEARYHFTMAESERDLTEISNRFETHLRAQFNPASPVPSEPQERDERIALLSALLQTRGAKGLEYYLARCLIARNQPGDTDRALPHARRATGPQAPAEAWVARIKVENQIFGSAAATQVAREGIKVVPPTKNLFSLYQSIAEILARDGKPGEAVELLREGIKVVPPTQSVSSLYQAAAEILASDSKQGEAVQLLREGIKAVLPAYGQCSLYHATAEILASDGKQVEAVELLREGIKVAPPTQLFSLYQAAAEILARKGKHREAVELLREGLEAVPPAQSSVLYQTAGIILFRFDDSKEALKWLKEGIAKVAITQGGSSLVEVAILIAYAENSLDQFRSLNLDQRQRDLLAIMEALNSDDFAGATELGAKLIARNQSYFPLYEQVAFAYLCIGKPALAQKMLRSFPGELLEGTGGASQWFQAFASIKLGNQQEARKYLERYLDGSANIDGMLTETFLLELWDRSIDFLRIGPAFRFPRLPPSLTGLTQTIVRPLGGGSVLTNDILQKLAKARHKEGITISGAILKEPARPPSQPSSFDAERTIRAMRPDGWYGLYVLGCYDQTKTVYVQQCRALTLVHALFEMGELKLGGRLGIIGGGAAGVTAAAAAARKGADVVLFEQGENLLPLQRQNTRRFLHPHLYDWPQDGSTTPHSQLPLLTWDADRSDKVAAQIVRRFEEVRQQTSRIDVKIGTMVQDIVRVPSANETDRVQILAAEGAINELVDVVIVAIGFGIEIKRHFGVETPSYWEDDGLDQSFDSGPNRPQRILISGSGDGALIDVMRSSLRDFRHEELLNLLPKGDALRVVEDQLRVIETKAKRAAAVSTSNFVSLHKMYAELPLNESLVEPIRKRIRHDTQVWFNFTSPGRYTTRSSVLNRFLVSILCRLNAVKPKLGRLDEKFVAVDSSGRYGVRWSLNEEPQIFDRVIVRHGPIQDYLGSVFPALAEASAPLRGKLRELNLTNTLDQATRDFFSTK